MDAVEQAKFFTKHDYEVLENRNTNAGTYDIEVFTRKLTEQLAHSSNWLLASRRHAQELRAVTIWGAALGTNCVPVAEQFLRQWPKLGSRVPGERGLNVTEAMLIVQLISLQQTADTRIRMAVLAERMGMTERNVRACIRRLADAGLVERIQHKGGENSFDMSGLIRALEELAEQEMQAASDRLFKTVKAVQ